MVDAVAAGPEAAATSFADFASAETLWDLIVTTSTEADRTVYTAPVLQRAFRRALDEAFSQGPEGYARDTVLAMSRWPFDLAGIGVPVDLWYGQQDTSPVHSPDLGGTLSRMIPSAVRHVLPAAAGSLLRTRSEAVLDTLLSRAR
ncbi:hypothetical protein [Streptomyces caelestis]|uniref:hypothetical protein n=1 Tax=Streptomyces caelestis TaxID=36816 RepID=UPI00364B6666